MRRVLTAFASWALLVPFALGYLAGLVVLAVVLCWFAVRDGYVAGRRKTP